jgi:hypothetical protein
LPVVKGHVSLQRVKTGTMKIVFPDKDFSVSGCPSWLRNFALATAAGSGWDVATPTDAGGCFTDEADAVAPVPAAITATTTPALTLDQKRRLRIPDSDLLQPVVLSYYTR